jgi:hypothetical protein
MVKRSKAVDQNQRKMRAILATKIFEYAKLEAGNGRADSADRAVYWADQWLDNAGAAATQWYFNT